MTEQASLGQAAAGLNGTGPPRDIEADIGEAAYLEWVRQEARDRVSELRQGARQASPPDDAFFASLTADLATPVESQRWLVDRLVGAYHNVILAALFKAGKTTSAINLAAALAEGGEFLGRLVTRPEGGIAFWNLEVHRADFNESYTGPLACAAPARIRTAHLRDYPVPLLKDRESRELALRHLGGVDVWFIDTWGRFCAWHDTDPLDNHGVGILLARLDEFKREAGIKCVVISAHMPHAARESTAYERALGAQAFSGWADSLITVSIDGDGGRFISATGRGTELASTSLIRVEGTSRVMTDGHNRTQTAEARLDWRLTLIIRGNPGVTASELRDLAGVQNVQVTQSVRRLITAGAVRREPAEPRRGQTVRHYPAEVVPESGS